MPISWDRWPTGAQTFTAEAAPVPAVGTDHGIAPAPGGVTDIRYGNPDECDAMRAALLEMADLPIGGSGQITGSSGTGSVVIP